MWPHTPRYMSYYIYVAPPLYCVLIPLYMCTHVRLPLYIVVCRGSWRRRREAARGGGLRVEVADAGGGCRSERCMRAQIAKTYTRIPPPFSRSLFPEVQQGCNRGAIGVQQGCNSDHILFFRPNFSSSAFFLSPPERDTSPAHYSAPCLSSPRPDRGSLSLLSPPPSSLICNACVLHLVVRVVVRGHIFSSMNTHIEVWEYMNTHSSIMTLLVVWVQYTWHSSSSSSAPSSHAFHLSHIYSSMRTYVYLTFIMIFEGTVLALLHLIFARPIIAQILSAYVSIRQHTSAYVSTLASHLCPPHHP